MPLVNTTVTGLINGVSKQPFQLRLNSQGADMVNCISDISSGVKRRQGAEYQFTFPVLEGGSLLDTREAYKQTFHFINEDDDNQFLVHIGGTDFGSGTQMAIYDLSDGTAQTLGFGTGATTFLELGAEPANSTFRLLTIGNETYIARTDFTPAMDAAVSPDPADWGMIHVKAGINGISYSVTLRNDTDPLPKESLVIAAGTGAINTTTIALALETQINADWAAEAQVPVVERHGSSLAIKWDDESDFDLNTSDGFGNTAITHAKAKGKVQAFSELPPVAYDGLITEVQGDPDVEADNYFVVFEAQDGTSQVTTATYGGSVRNYGTGIWVETLKWNTVTSIDPDTMPFLLTHTSGVNWDLDPIAWGDRVVGDDITAPDPSFIGANIMDLVFHKNRLGLMAGESIVFSGVDDFPQFFPTTVVTISDDDRIDVVANFRDIARYKHAVSFKEAVIMFADSGAYALIGSPDGFTSQTVSLSKIASFDGGMIAPPVLAGDRIFFATSLATAGADQDTRKARVSIFELTPAIDTETFLVEPINEHALGFIPDQIPDSSPVLAADGGLQMLIYQPSERFSSTEGGPNHSAMYPYQYFTSNREKVQSAWHQWHFNAHDDSMGIDTNVPNPSLDGMSQQMIRGAFLNGYFYCVSTGDANGGFSTRDNMVSRIPIATQNTNLLAFAAAGGGGGPDPYEPPFTDLPFFDWFQQTVAPTSFDGTHTLYEVRGEWVFATLGAPGTIMNIPLVDYVMIPEASSGPFVQGTPVVVATATITGVGTPGNTMLRVLGDGTGLPVNMTFGIRYRSHYRFTSPVMKTPQNTAILGGRTVVRRLKAVLKEAHPSITSYTVPEDFVLDAGVTLDHQQTHVNKRTIEKAIQKDNFQFEAGFFTNHATKDFELIGAEWAIDFSNRGRNI